MNNDGLSDEDLITLYARLLLSYNYLPDDVKASAITRDLNLSLSRTKQIFGQIHPFVTDRLSNKELSEAALEYCRRMGLIGTELSEADWISIAMALRISAARFREFTNYLATYSEGWTQRKENEHGIS